MLRGQIDAARNESGTNRFVVEPPIPPVRECRFRDSTRLVLDPKFDLGGSIRAFLLKARYDRLTAIAPALNSSGDSVAAVSHSTNVRAFLKRRCTWSRSL